MGEGFMAITTLRALLFMKKAEESNLHICFLLPLPCDGWGLREPHLVLTYALWTCMLHMLQQLDIHYIIASSSIT